MDFQLRRKTYAQISIWTAAGIAGLFAVGFAKVIAVIQAEFFVLFKAHPYLLSAASPLFFVLATGLVVKLAPNARGSGIPQVLEAIEHKDWKSSLVSIRTAVVKVFSVLVGIFGGASIGREGPTVQLAASTFAFVGSQFKKILPEVDFQSYLTAGAAAGVAAAFNTPIAGITFALEEISEGMFGPFRDLTILAVVISGITAQAIIGDYLYFGRPLVATDAGPGFFPLLAISLALGLLGGILGGIFSRALAYPNPLRLPGAWWARALVCGIVCAALGLWTSSETSGSGYEITRQYFEAPNDALTLSQWRTSFPLLKLVTTILSYLSGMAGGIFSPCLSIGAGLGFSFAKLLHLRFFKECALIGMTAFFSGAVQAPLTAVVIVMEMTDQQSLVFALLIGAFVAKGVGAILMPVPLYRCLAHKAMGIADPHAEG